MKSSPYGRVGRAISGASRGHRFRHPLHGTLSPGVRPPGMGSPAIPRPPGYPGVPSANSYGPRPPGVSRPGPRGYPVCPGRRGCLTGCRGGEADVRSTGRFLRAAGIASESPHSRSHLQHEGYVKSAESWLGIGWENAALRELAGMWHRLTPSVRHKIMELARGGRVSREGLEAG